MSFLGPGADEVDVEYTSVGGVDVPQTYNCTKFHEDNPNRVEVFEEEFFYDLLCPKSEPTDFSVGLVEAKLLDEVAAHFGVFSGISCVQPALNTIWAVAISSQPDDVPNKALDASATCIELEPDSTQACTTYTGKISLSVVGPYDSADVIEIVKVNMNSGAVTAGGPCQVRFLGTMIDEQLSTGRDELPPAVSEVEEPVSQSSDDSVTPEGVIFVMGLVAAFLGLLFVVVWRIRKRRRNDRAIAVSESVGHAEASAPTGNDLEKAAVQGFTIDGENEPKTVSTQRYDVNNNEDLPEVPNQFDNTYSFEMGDIQRLEMLGLHGTGVVTGAGGREAGETSDSDVDSWAQTDASLGSIELRLEPITAEV